MNISLNNQINNSFKGNSYVEDYRQVKKEFKEAVKAKSSKEVFDSLYKRLDSVEKTVKGQISKPSIPAVFRHLVKFCAKSNSKTGNKVVDTASLLTNIVLWGNVGKEAVGTTMYTVQAWTNTDLPKDKRKFVGLYDLSVGLVSTAFSFIFGVGLEKSIKKKYKNMLKPLTSSSDAALRSRAGAAIVGLAAFSSFALQTIVGKRIVAPAVATPVAGRLKKKLEDKELQKNSGEKSDVKYTKQGFVDTKKSKFV